CLPIGLRGPSQEGASMRSYVGGLERREENSTVDVWTRPPAKTLDSQIGKSILDVRSTTIQCRQSAAPATVLSPHVTTPRDSECLAIFKPASWFGGWNVLLADQQPPL